jgi:pyruvate formate lyase activating enzyme
MTGGSLDPVLETLKTIVMAGKHLEITLLIIPTLNDSPDEFSRMTDWILNELGPGIPLHLSRYFPAYKLTLPPTSMTTLNQFASMACEKLNYVFTGNVSNDDYSSTFCPRCKAELIRRNHYDVTIMELTREGKCSNCGAVIPIRI